MVRRKKIETDSSIKTGNDELSMVTEIETAPENLSADELEKEFPIMTLRNMVMFPSVVMPVTAGRRTTRIRNAWWKHNCHPSGKQHQGTS